MATKTVVDMIPVFEMGDVKKVYDHGANKVNQIVLGVLHNLKMEEGTMPDFRDLGCLDTLMQLWFSENVVPIINTVNQKLQTYNGDGISVSFSYTDSLKENITIDITIENVPDFKLTADLVKSNQSMKIINPKLVEV